MLEIVKVAVNAGPLTLLAISPLERKAQLVRPSKRIEEHNASIDIELGPIAVHCGGTPSAYAPGPSIQRS